jgi:hypothetical protein
MKRLVTCKPHPNLTTRTSRLRNISIPRHQRSSCQHNNTAPRTLFWFYDPISRDRRQDITEIGKEDAKMPAIRHASKRKAPPAGFTDIEDDLLIFSNKMKDAENEPTINVPRHQAHWKIFQISHQRSRYVYGLYYEKEAISKQLYEWLLKNGYADAMLIAKWKKTGYEKVC